MKQSPTYCGRPRITPRGVAAPQHCPRYACGAAPCEGRPDDALATAGDSCTSSEPNGERRFPVVYTLDAAYSLLIARNVTDHLSERDHLREVVVVGIGYRDQEPGRTAGYRRNRTRDYTPTFVRDGGYGPELQKTSGGGPKFLEALETEIVPFIDRHYRTDPGERVLVGHSPSRPSDGERDPQLRLPRLPLQRAALRPRGPVKPPSSETCLPCNRGLHRSDDPSAAADEPAAPGEGPPRLFPRHRPSGQAARRAAHAPPRSKRGSLERAPRST